MSNIQQRAPEKPQMQKAEPLHLQHWTSRKEQILTRIPPWIRREKFDATVRTAYFESAHMLMSTTPESFLYAVTACAELGLILGKLSGHAYLVTFKHDCQLIIGYKGLIFLAIRSGLVKSVDLHAVYHGQQFECWMENNEWKNKHVPFGEVSTKDQDITHVYCVITLSDGTKKFAVMTRDQVEDVRKKAFSANSPAWRNHWGEMAKKTVLRRAFKTLPIDSECEIGKAIAFDDTQYLEPAKKTYLEHVAEANTIELQRLDVVEKSHNREHCLKYVEIASKKGLELGKSKEQVAEMNEQELASFLLHCEGVLARES